MKTVWKRIFAFLFDWVTLFALSCLVGFLFIGFTVDVMNDDLSVALGFLIAIFMGGALLYFRDVIFGARSLGKRIFGLYIYDAATLQRASRKQRAIKGLLSVIMEIDFFFLVITERTLGERAAKTYVLASKDPEAVMAERRAKEPSRMPPPSPYGYVPQTPPQTPPPYVPQTPPPYVPPQTKPRRSVKKMVILFVSLGILSFLLFFGAIAGVVAMTINGQTESESYQVAHAYVVNRREFKELGVPESDLRLNSFSVGTYYENGERIQYADYGMVIKNTAYDCQISLEKTGDGEWRVVGFDCDFK